MFWVGSLMSQVLQWTQFWALIWSRRFTTLAFHEFVNARRAITLLGTGIDRQVDGRRYVGVLERQMNRLVFLVIGVRYEHRRQAVEGQHAVGLGIVDRLGLVLGLERFVIGLVLQRPRQRRGRAGRATCRARRRACRPSRPNARPPAGRCGPASAPWRSSSCGAHRLDKLRATSLERSAAIASNAASAASIADFIAVWLPLIRGTFTKPAEQPISAPPGNASLGMACKPPSLIARAP